MTRATLSNRCLLAEFQARCGSVLEQERAVVLDRLHFIPAVEANLVISGPYY